MLGFHCPKETQLGLGVPFQLRLRNLSFSREFSQAKNSILHLILSRRVQFVTLATARVPFLLKGRVPPQARVSE